jgi:hypothetical protein
MVNLFSIGKTDRREQEAVQRSRRKTGTGKDAAIVEPRA